MRYSVCRRLLSSFSPKTPANWSFYAERFLLSHHLFRSRKDTDSPPLIISHGFLGSKTNWRALARNFNSSGRDVAAVDLRNHGYSRHSDYVTYEIMANDVLHTMDKVFPDNVFFDLMGHSMGGKVSMILALQNPEVVDRLIVVDVLPSPFDPPPSAIESFEALQDVKIDKSKSVADVRASVVIQLIPIVKDLTVCNWLATNIDWTPERGVFWKCNIKNLKSIFEVVCDFPDTPFEPFTGPVLFIQGENSDITDDSRRDEVCHRYFPKAQFAVIEGAGHWVHYDKPYEFIRTVEKFLAR